MKARAAVAWEPQKPLVIEEIDVKVPRKVKCLLKVVAQRVSVIPTPSPCPATIRKAPFPCVLGHEGGCEVVECGPGVKTLKPGDHVIPLYIPECGECEYCRSAKPTCARPSPPRCGPATCPTAPVAFPTRARPLYHYMGCSTFAEYTVVPEIALAKINPAAPLDKVCLLGCGVTTGIGAVLNTAKVEARRDGRGLRSRRHRPVGDPGRGHGAGRAHHRHRYQPGQVRSWPKQLGATDFVNPKERRRRLSTRSVEMTNGGVDYSFECIGNVDVMREALECCHMGWGESIIIGVAGAGQEIHTRPFQLVTGRIWQGTAFGGVKGRTRIARLCRSLYEGRNRTRFHGHPYVATGKHQQGFRLDA